MRRSLIWSALLDLEPIEFGQTTTRQGDPLTTMAENAVPAAHRNQYEGVREWLATITPEDRTPGWLARYADTLLVEDTVVQILRDGTWSDYSRTTRLEWAKHARICGTDTWRARDWITGKDVPAASVFVVVVPDGYHVEPVDPTPPSKRVPPPADVVGPITSAGVIHNGVLIEMDDEGTPVAPSE